MKTEPVVYNERLLMPGSTAYELYHNTKDEDHMKKLKEHMKQLDKNYQELLKRYD